MATLFEYDRVKKTCLPLKKEQVWRRRKNPFDERTIENVWDTSDGVTIDWVKVLETSMFDNRDLFFSSWEFVRWEGEKETVDRGRYPQNCNRCGSAAYFGIAPGDYECSNIMCPTNKKTLEVRT